VGGDSSSGKGGQRDASGTGEETEGRESSGGRDEAHRTGETGLRTGGPFGAGLGVDGQRRLAVLPHNASQICGRKTHPLYTVFVGYCLMVCVAQVLEQRQSAANQKYNLEK